MNTYDIHAYFPVFFPSHEHVVMNYGEISITPQHCGVAPLF